MTIAYLAARYPAAHQTYVQRELAEVERRGYRVVRCSLETSADHASSDPNAAATWSTDATNTTARFAALRRALASPNRPRAWDACRCTANPSKTFTRAALCAVHWTNSRVRHVHAHFGLEAAAVARAAFLLGGPRYSIAIHGPEEFDEAVTLDLQGKVRDAAFVTSISRFSKGQLCRWIDRPLWDRAHVIGCSVPERLFANEPVTSHHKNFVFVGRLVPQKGPELLIEAFAAAHKRGIDAELVIVGDGPMRQTLVNQAASLGIADHVRFTGWLDETGVRSELTNARAFVMGSFSEGLPLACMEAFATGRPVIAPRIAGIPELVKDRENGWLFTCGDTRGLADAIEAAARSDESVLNLMGERGRRAVRARHLTETETTRLANLFERALAGETPVNENPELDHRSAEIKVRVHHLPASAATPRHAA